MRTKYITIRKDSIIHYLNYLLDKIDSIYYQEINTSIKRTILKIENNNFLE